jgi:hypothetical protein
MIEFIQKQIEASERLFEMMRSDHDTRMKEMEHWARTTQSLIEKLHERDMTIDMLRNGKNVSKTDTNVPKNKTALGDLERVANGDDPNTQIAYDAGPAD